MITLTKSEIAYIQTLSVEDYNNYALEYEYTENARINAELKCNDWKESRAYRKQEEAALNRERYVAPEPRKEF